MPESYNHVVQGMGHLGGLNSGSQLSTDVYVEHDGSTIDTFVGSQGRVAVTLIAADKDVKFIVYGSNTIDHADKQRLTDEAIIAVGSVGAYLDYAFLRYLHVEIKSRRVGQHGTVTVNVASR
jgi:hypothetical protein